MTDKGAHYHRCDFQVHSPRDIQWTGADCVSEEERMAYAAKLVEACRDKGLNAIAITDHHDLAFVPFVRRAALAETDAGGTPLRPEQRLIVFPGIELTLAVPCQAILVLDADFEDNRFGAVLTALAINPAPDAEAKTAQTMRLENIQSLKTLKEKLDEHSWLRDRYIVYPNVTGEGKFSLLRNGMMAKYKEMPFVGGYVDGAVTDLKPGPISILDGRDRAWGNKRIACIQTSDNRREDHNDLGRHTSWIKWAKPTAEALRQACLAQESRISHDEPKLPSVVISSISVTNSQFLGPIDLTFNPQYNTLIGGRGTGKSTILEYLRWALCDQPPATGDPDAPNYQSRRSRLIDNTLRPLGSTVDVTFTVNDVAHTVRRDSKDGGLLIKIGSDEMRPCSEAEVRSLLPVQAYSQKQLSDVSVRTEELARFITAPIRMELEQLDRRISEKAERIRQTYANRRRQQVLSAEIARRTLEARSLQEQVDAIRNSLTGLSDDDRALLNNGKSYTVAENAVEGWLNDIAVLANGLSGLSFQITNNLDGVEPPPEAPEAEILKAAHGEYVALMLQANIEVEALIEEVSKPLAAAEGSPWAEWQKRLVAFRAAYDAALHRSSAHRERMEQLQTLEARLSAYQKETVRLNDELRSLKTAEEIYATERKGWLELKVERDRLLDTECQRLTVDASGAIRAHVLRYADATQFVERLRESLAGSNVRRERVEALAAAITGAENPQERWSRILEELEALGMFNPDQEGSELRPETPALLAAGLSPADLDRMARKLSTDDWLALSLIDIKSEPVFEYRARESDYIPFGNASAGQQATALLKTLLNQPGPPLLIDQPEEDLDNPVMQEIVEQLWKAKQKRQIIFVSHNANLVVNGDAELVAWCDYRKAGDQSGGKIAGEGAIDVPEVREAIKRIMEGGEAAFNLRREKYGF
ncbi:type III restriction enzyme [Bradyrhizobium japonicum]|uniref:TrlF family AAA-like ATPase n=1 Tax=Bradyrhizobium japonicum TaxID=375 RepID=UPI002168A253|nr:AAA family ATPase [Bradyrhizobium japonicum]MCS3497475.1 type III restriction enzyme [Bradyrhizobium japonicum]MCS3960363.1 type III restriction enzyme [Bradyrhizobium japonicum]MCS4002117.1 type III restriction enzyme [Bradyrhizobium japonicum]